MKGEGQLEEGVVVPEMSDSDSGSVINKERVGFDQVSDFEIVLMKMKEKCQRSGNRKLTQILSMIIMTSLISF
jgi:hypothetical protein